MEATENAINLIKKYEGFRSKAYLCPAGVWTIGYGTTVYPDGSRVRKSDKFDEWQCEAFFLHDVNKFSKIIDAFTTDKVNQNQFNALVVFAYSVGAEALRKSTLLKMVNENPNNPKIKGEFLKWVYADGKKLFGLVKRRNEEADLYFK